MISINRVNINQFLGGKSGYQHWKQCVRKVSFKNTLAKSELTISRIQNPLIHMSEEEMLRDVDIFTKENNFEAIGPLLRKGALVARNPVDFANVPGITEAEKDAIANEVLHKWRQPKLLYFTIILCSVGAAVQGWDQTGSNGANLSFPDALGIPVRAKFADGTPNPNAEHNQWLQGLINAGPYIASAFL